MGTEMSLNTLAAEINILHESAQNAASSAIQYAARCGAKLNAAKEQLKHGEWLPWLEINCKVTHAQANRYRKLADEMPELLTDSNCSHGSNFDSIKTAIAYLASPDEVKEKVNASDSPVTEKQIKEWVAKQKELEERAEEWRIQYRPRLDCPHRARLGYG